MAIWFYVIQAALIRMKSSGHITLLLFVSAILTSGCGIATTMTAANVSHPVMLGKIQSIQTAENQPLPKIVPFNIEIYHHSFFEIAYVPTAGNKADVKLLKLIDSPSDMVMIDEVNFGSKGFIWGTPCGAGGGSNDSWVNIVGGIHKFPAGIYDTK